jgi:tRNA U34 5-carboxymethylaminomethyl modifying enzyme MnmG/GidA
MVGSPEIKYANYIEINPKSIVIYKSHEKKEVLHDFEYMEKLTFPCLDEELPCNPS